MKTDTRNIIVADGQMGISSSGQRQGQSLCDFCYHRDNGSCPFIALGAVETCVEFIPVLTFADQAGLTGRFTTFRPSAIWFDRARVLKLGHKRIGLVTTAGEHIAMGTVLGAFRGRFEDLMAAHAFSNHLCKANLISKNESAAWLTRWIRNKMGSRYAIPDKIGTVIRIEVARPSSTENQGDPI